MAAIPNRLLKALLFSIALSALCLAGMTCSIDTASQVFVENGDFNLGEDGWFLYTHAAGATDPGNGVFYVAYGEAVVQILNPGTTRLSVILGHEISSLAAGKTYRVRFFARSDSAQTFAAGAYVGGSFPAGQNPFQLTATMALYSFTFTVVNPPPETVYFMLFLGLGGTGTFTIDNVSITAEAEPANYARINYDTSTLPLSANARGVLDYLIDLSNGDQHGTIVGQNCGHGSEIADPSDGLGSYNALVEHLQADTGRWVGMIGIECDYVRAFTPAQLSQANQVFIGYWNAGGLVTINWAPQNPWLNDESDIEANPGVPSNVLSVGPNGENNLLNVDLNKLINPAEPIYIVWRRKLDRIANALLELRNAGVVVLWRPMQEMNGHWFWWGSKTHPNDPAPYVNLYRDMYDYFVNVKGLDNLLWVYSPQSGYERDSLWAYPGGDYVNVVAPTSYSCLYEVIDYSRLLVLNRPLGMGEYGGTKAMAVAQSIDNLKYLETVRRYYPMISFFVCWHNWEIWKNGSLDYTVRCSINTNQHAFELMNHADAITRDELNWH